MTASHERDDQGPPTERTPTKEECYDAVLRLMAQALVRRAAERHFAKRAQLEGGAEHEQGDQRDK